MAGPYYKGQRPDPCGCYYPDVTHIGFSVRDGSIGSIFWCSDHGECLIPISQNIVPDLFCVEHPPEEWREGERRRLLDRAAISCDDGCPVGSIAIRRIRERSDK